jgi:hypothetical protein
VLYCSKKGCRKPREGHKTSEEHQRKEDGEDTRSIMSKDNLGFQTLSSITLATLRKIILEIEGESVI